MSNEWSLQLRREGPVAGRGADPAGAVFREARQAITEMTAYVQRQVVQRAPRGATGFLRGSIYGEVRGRTLEQLRGQVASPAKYGVVVERGRTAGKPMPPWREGSGLYLWVQRKLGVRGEETRSVAYVVARSIARKGTRGRAPFGEALKASLPRIASRIRRLGYEIKERLGG